MRRLFSLIAKIVHGNARDQFLQSEEKTLYRIRF